MNNWEEKYQKLVSSGFSDVAIDEVLAEQNKKLDEKAKKAEKHLIELHNVDTVKTNVSARENIRNDKMQTQKRIEEIREKIEYNKEHIEDRRRVLKDNCKKIANVLEFRKRLEAEKEDLLKQILEIQSNKKILNEKKKIEAKKAKLEAKVAELRTKVDGIKANIEKETDPKKKVQLHRELTAANVELNKNDNELLRTNMYLKSKSEEFTKIEKDNAEKSKEERRLKSRFQKVSNSIAKCDFACSNLMDGKSFDDISLSFDNWKNQKFTYKKVDKEQDKSQEQEQSGSEKEPPKDGKGESALTAEEKEKQEKIEKVKEDIERLKKDQEKYRKPIVVEKKGIMKFPIIGTLATKILETIKNREAKRELENYEGYIAKKEKELKELEKAQATTKEDTGLVTEKTTAEELSKMPVEELAKISASEFNKMQADELFEFAGSDKYKEVMKYKQEKAAEEAKPKEEPKEKPKIEPEVKENGRESFQRKLRQMSSYQDAVNKMGSDYLKQVAEKGQDQVDKEIYEKIKKSKTDKINRQFRKEGKNEIGADAAMKRQDDKFGKDYSDRSGDRDIER